MITKAIVEEVISPYQIRVRIPLLDRAETASLSTSKEDLNIATICTLPNCYINVQVGDIVFVGFEDNTYYKAVVLGHLCMEKVTESYPDMTVGNITVKSAAELPSETSIGLVNSFELSCLSGLTDNIQKQLDNIYEQQKIILKQLLPDDTEES